MAFVSNNQEDEEDKNTAQNPSQGPVSPGSGGSSVHLAPTSGVGSTGAGAAPSANGTPAAGGSFATLDKYVGANQGGAQGLADNITKGIGDQYNSLNSSNQSTLNGIQGNVNSAYTPQDTGVLSAEAADPVSFASNPTNISSFQKQLNDQYTGPASAESDAGYQKQQADINNAISQGNASTQTEAGRAGLLRQTEAAPTQGVTSLNSAILSQDPSAQGKIESAYQPFSNLLTGLSTGAQGIDTSIGKAQTDSAAANKAANDQIAGQVNGLNSAITGTVDQDEAARAAYNTELQQYQSTYNPLSTSINSVNELFANAPADFGKFGSINNPYAAALGQSVNNNVATANAVATPDQYKQAGAFQALLSGLNGPAPILDQSTAAQAGTYTPQTPFSGPTAADTGASVLNQETAAEPVSARTMANASPDELNYYNSQLNPAFQSLAAALHSAGGAPKWNSVTNQWE